MKKTGTSRRRSPKRGPSRSLLQLDRHGLLALDLDAIHALELLGSLSLGEVLVGGFHELTEDFGLLHELVELHIQQGYRVAFQMAGVRARDPCAALDLHRHAHACK